MPLGDEKHKLIYAELVNILGSEYVTDDRGATSIQPESNILPGPISGGQVRTAKLNRMEGSTL